MTTPLPVPTTLPSQYPRESPRSQLILIVDDQPANLKVLRGILAPTLYQLTFASSGQQALDRIQLTPPDLILLDVMMPGMDGLEVCRQLKQSIEYDSIPIIFLTANHELETLTEAFDLGAVDYVTKPFRTPELLARIKTHLHLKRLQQQLQQQSLQEQVLRKIITGIHSALDTNTLLTSTVQQLQQFLSAPRVLVGQYMSSTMMQIVVTSDESPTATIEVPQESLQTATHIALNQKSNPTATDIEWLQHWQVKSELRCPLWCRDELWGCLMFQSLTSELIVADWLAFLEPIVDQLQIALQQAELLGQLEQANAELLRLANTDSLTQLANRRYLHTHVEREWLRLRREQNPLSFILMDVDYFKRYNDIYGHLQGDECLRLIGQALASVIKRPADLAVRYGGEEFLLVLSNTDATGAVAVGQQIQAAMKQLKILHAGHQSSDYVTLSLGISTQTPTANSSWLSLLELADQALYKAKDQGRNGYVLAPLESSEPV